MSQPNTRDHNTARATTYRLLARLALSELDAPLARQLSPLPILGPALQESGGEAALPRLRSDYTHTFLMNAHPYESVYVDESGMLNAATTGAVLAYYQEHAFDPPAARTTGAPDHLGLELEFMAHLIDRTTAAPRIANIPVAAALDADQLHFLEHHLARWAPLFGETLQEVALTPLYRVYGEAVLRFVLQDLQNLADGDAA